MKMISTARAFALVGASLGTIAIASPVLAQSDPLDPPTAPASTTAAPPTPECAVAANNCSLIEQAGTDLVVDVNQSGSGNVSDVDQVNGATGDGSTIGVDIDQSGANNQSYVLQDATTNSTVAIVQDGVGAESSVIQLDAQGHKVSVSQTGASDSFVFQEGPDFGGDSRVEIVQFGGDGNTSIAFQQSVSDGRIGQPGGSANGVTQNGSDNNSEVYQGDFVGTGNANRLSAEVNQEGFTNDSFISQSNLDPVGQVFPNANTRVRVNQFGIQNESSVVQTGARGGQSTGFNVDVDQFGSENVSRVEQTNLSSAPGVASTVAVRQLFDGNDSFVDQRAGSGFVDIDQISDFFGIPVTSATRDLALFVDVTVRGNFAEVTQFGDDRVEFRLVQNGRGNAAVALQTNNSGGPGFTTVNQYGIDNTSESVQEANNLITVDQGTSGDDAERNTSTINQSGFGNLIDVDQNGDDNLSRIEQLAASSSNEAYVTQNGSSNASFMTQGGFDNIATVIQNGTNDTSSITQFGTGNMATVNQGTP